VANGYPVESDQQTTPPAHITEAEHESEKSDAAAPAAKQTDSRFDDDFGDGTDLQDLDMPQQTESNSAGQQQQEEGKETGKEQEEEEEKEKEKRKVETEKEQQGTALNPECAAAPHVVLFPPAQDAGNVEVGASVASRAESPPVSGSSAAGEASLEDIRTRAHAVWFFLSLSATGPQ